MIVGIFSDEELAADAMGADAPAPEPQPDPAPDQLPEPQQPDPDADRARGPDGKFVAKEGEEQPPKGGQVPQGALHAERERRKAAEAETAKFREQLDAIAAMRAQVASRAPAPLPPEDDPAQIAHLRQRLEQMEQGQTRITQERDNQALDQAEQRQLQAAIASSEVEFRTAQPDYDAAVQYVIEARARELQLHGLNPVEVQQAVAEEAQDIVRSAIRQGRSPAEMAYQIAQSRGYRAETPQQPAAQPQGGAAATLAAINATKNQSQSLGRASGSTPQTINADTVAGMTGDEFDALYSTPQGRALIDNL
jgi:hypothetical protein